MRAPRSDVVLRRFLAGESLDYMGWRDVGHGCQPGTTIPQLIRPAYRRILEYEAALRRAMNKPHRRKSR